MSNPWHHRSCETNALRLRYLSIGRDEDRCRFGIRDLIGSSIADKDSVCLHGFVTIEHREPIPDSYPNYFASWLK